MTSKPDSKRLVTNIITGFCVVIIAIWQLGILRTKSQTTALRLPHSQFADFSFVYDGAKATRISREFDDTQANILLMTLPYSSPQGDVHEATLRLVYGYNMRDCMRIKGYTVTQLPVTESDVPVEAWEILSRGGTKAVWLTAIIRANDFSYLQKSVGDFDFPRVGIPDEQNWKFKGTTTASIRHPIRNFCNLIRAKWNGARCDLGTFLKIKKPATPSSAVLTVIAIADMEPGMKTDETLSSLKTLQRAFVDSLQSKSSTPTVNQSTTSPP